MKIIKLVDVFNTKYFADQWCPDLAVFLENNKDVVIDIADARLPTACANILFNSGNILTDTLNPSRNTLSEMNNKIRKEDYITEKLPLFRYGKDNIQEYISGIDVSKVYSVSRKEIPFSVLILLARPSVDFDFSFLYPDLFDYAGSVIYPAVCVWDSFNVLHGLNYYTISANPNGLFQTLTDTELLTQNELTERHRVLPAEFGNRPLTRDKLWYPLIDKAIDDIDRLHTRARRMIDFVTQE